MVPGTPVARSRQSLKHHEITTANRHPGRTSFMNKYMRNATPTSGCAYHVKITSSRGPPLKIYCPNKSSYKKYRQEVNKLTWPAYSAAHYHPVLLPS